MTATLERPRISRPHRPARRRPRRRHSVTLTLLMTVMLAYSWLPLSARAVPRSLLCSQLHRANTPWAIIVPSLVSPFGLYLIWVYAADAVPTELIEAARIDGAGEFRTFFTISLRLLGPGLVTVL